MAKCSCGAEIVFAWSPKGARIPLRRVTGHVYHLEMNDSDPELPLATSLDPDQEYWLSHFIDCPDRARYSGRSRDKAKR